MYFRPRNFGEVFGIQFSRPIPFWIYPWHYGQCTNPNYGWLDNLSEVPDIMTHFCKIGIKRSRIEDEYFWLERAYEMILRQGYRPQKNSYIEAFELSNENESVFIIKDGNHRISALAVLGYQEVIVKLSRSSQIYFRDYRKWPQVRFGTYSEQDAIDLVNVYFAGVDGFKRSDLAAKILDE